MVRAAQLGGIDMGESPMRPLMLANGVRTIWTRDRDYRKFRGIRVHDPLAT
jgi:hypothetical protein